MNEQIAAKFGIAWYDRKNPKATEIGEEREMLTSLEMAGLLNSFIKATSLYFLLNFSYFYKLGSFFSYFSKAGERNITLAGELFPK